MDVDAHLPELPFVAGGLRSLVALPSSADDPALVQRVVQVVELLETYFCNKEVRSILGQARHHVVRATGSPFQGWVSGWVPLEMLAAFKTVKALKLTPFDLLVVVQQWCHAAFDVDPDALCVRRTIAFDLPTPQERLEWSTRPAASDLVLEVTGFEDAPAKIEVAAVFGRCGEVRDVVVEMGGPNGDEHAAFVTFAAPDTLAKVLATTHHHEASLLRLRMVRKSTPPPAAASGPLYPALHAVSAAAKPLRSLGNPSVHPSALLGYPLNRVLKFGPIPDDLRGVSSLPLLVQSVRECVAQYGPVVEVAVGEGVAEGHVRFKTGIAKEVEGFLKVAGGIEVKGEVLEVKALSGEEERIFHETLRLKQPPHVDLIPLTPSVSPKKPRAKPTTSSSASIRVRSRRGRARHALVRKPPQPASARADVPELEVSSKKNRFGKRPAAADGEAGGDGMVVDDDDGMDGLCEMMGVGGGRAEERRVAKPNKRVKVEHVDTLFKGLTTV
ncbi:hypothetical protein HDU96_010904 [Phlyctochytrium bullatum]|nr:hypothetical protein HDU96_010904 [Phlyctochytrium bullatum]